MPLYRLFDDITYSDLTIYLGKSQLKLHAHRIILGLRSPYFQVAFKSQMQEAITGEFRLPENDEHALWRVFQYMYTNDYNAELERPSGAEGGLYLVVQNGRVNISKGEDPEVLRHPRVYALADLFRIEELKKLSVRKFEEQIGKQNLWSSEAFADCIREVYTTTPDQDLLMRNVVVQVVVAHIKDLSKRKWIQDLIRDEGDFAVDLFQKISEKHIY